MSLIFLPRVNRVPVIPKIGVVGIQGENRDKPRHIGNTVIANAKQSEPMLAEVKSSFPIQLVLLSMFQAVEKSVAVGRFEGHPRFGSGAYRSDQINVAIIAGKGDEWIQSRTKPVRCRQIDGMIPFPNIERSAIDLDTFQNLGNKYVGIGITVAMCVGRQIIGYEIAADRDVLRNGLPVIPRYAGRKIL